MNIPEEWTVKSLSDVVEIQRGFDLSHNARRPGPYPVLTAGETGGFHDEGPIKGPGVTIGRATNLGKPKWSDVDFWPHNTTMFVKDFKGNSRRWVYHLFEATDLSGFDSGSVQPMLNRNYIAHVQVRVPPFQEQVAIAEVLGALDDKIAANTKIARTSLELAQIEFQQLLTTPTTEVALRDVLRLEYGKSLAAARRIDGDVDVFGSGGIVGTHNEPLLSGPGVIVGRKGTAGAVHWAPRDYFPIDTTYYVVPVNGDASLVFCLHLLKSLGLDEMNSDSAVPGLNREEALSASVRMPGESEIRQFTASAERLFSLADQVDRESRALVTIRDALLPQLMSGKLQIKEAEELVAALI